MGGFTGQYRLAGARAYAALRQGELLWVRLADPAAGRVDDFQIGTNGRVDAYQIKWSRFAGTLSFRDFTRDQVDAPSYVAQLADGWARLRSVHTGARIVVHFVTNDRPSTADRLPPAGRGDGRAATSVGTFAAFVVECWGPARAAAISGADLDAVVSQRWRPAWEALQQATHLEAEDWPAFVRDCELEFGTPSLDAVAGGAAGPAADATDWRADVDTLATLFQRLVADPEQQVQFSRDELLDALAWRGRVEYRHRHEFPDPDIPYRAVTSSVKAVRDAIAAFPSGYVAVVGTPGSGKSTLLTRTLRYAPERVIRYYAYVPTSVGPNVRRGEATHFLHDLVVALERQGIRAGRTLPAEDVARLAEQFEAQLQALSDEWRRTGRKTILLVDGLDHISREQFPAQSLLTELPHPDRVPEGVLIILGSQTDRLPGLAAAVRDQLDQLGRRLTMQPLAREDVLAIVRETKLEPVPTVDEQDRVFALTAGHPLALNYVLNRLRGSDGRPVAEVLDQVAPFRDRIDVQYVAHWQQVESDFGLVRLLALLARLRGAIRIRSIELWAPREAVYRLVREFGYYFRQEPNGRWAFFHNSFRAFLVERTRGLPGLGPEQALYRDLAQQCAATLPDDPTRWDELYYRSRAGDHEAVLALAQPDILREQFLAGRPADVISADATDAVTAAVATRDVIALTRTLLVEAEFAQRAHYQGLLPMAELQLALGDTDAAVDAIRDGAQLRVEPEAALRAAAALDTRGLRDEARAVFALAEPVDVLGATTPIEGHQLREVRLQLATWIEVAPRFRGLKDVLGVIEQLQVADDQVARRHPNGTTRHHGNPLGVDVDLTADLRGDLLHALVRALDELGRPDDADAVTDYLFDSAIMGGSAWFWSAVDGWRYAQSVGDYLRARRRFQAMLDGLARWSGGALDASETAALAEGLVRVMGDAHAARALVSELPQPAPVSALTASSSDDGFEPFVTRFVLNRVLGAVQDERPLSEVVPDAEGESQRLVFFERAVVTVARLHGATWTGRRLSAASFVGAATPVLRLFQNVGQHWRDGWHLAVAARGELYELLVRAAALHGPDVVAALRSSLDRIWADPTLGADWPPELKRRIVLALLDAGTDRTWAAAQLRRTEPQLFEGEALEQELTEAAGQVGAWLAVGDADAARATLRTILAAAFGVEYKDYQMDDWVRWCARANRSDPVDASARIARVAAAVGGIRGAHGSTSATKSLIRMAATGGPAIAFAVTEWCTQHGLTGWVASLNTLLPAVLERAPRSAPTATAFYRHLMLPFDECPSSNVLSAILRALDSVDAGVRNRARAVLGCHRTPECGHAGTLQKRPRRRWGEYAARRRWRASVTDGYASGAALLRRRSR